MDRSKDDRSATKPAPELVSKAEAGDRKAFRSLYELQKDQVYHSVLMLLGSRDRAAEVTTDVFVHLYQNPPKSPAEFSVAMYRTAVQKCAAYMHAGQNDQLTAAQARAVSQTQGTRRRELLHKLVAAAMNGLKPELRIPFVLCEGQGLSYDEIARILDTNSRTVASRLANAREQLAGALGEVSFEAWNVG